MSSWKKASKTGQKFHKERGQLKEREHLGFLEKKKDYKLRALDYQKKRDAILNLKRKILEKNPDEFYFNMVKTHMKEGEHRLRKADKEFTEDELKLMKSQDINYIKMHLQMELKKIEKLKSAMHLIEFGGLPENKHKYFHEKGDELVESTSSDASKSKKSRSFGRVNGLTIDQLENVQLPTWVDDDYVNDMIKARTKKYKELIKRCSRAESLRKLEAAYDLKQKKTNPEDEYDEKYNSKENQDDSSAKKYMRVIPRKK